MLTRQFIIATIVGAITLFLFDGAFQAIPNFGVGAVERIEASDLASTKFEQLTNKMNYIVTDKSVSFVATKKAEYYNLSRFFLVEMFTALAVAFLFAFLFVKIKVQSLKERLWLTFAFAIIASFAINLAYFNWWGFSFAYTIGVVFKMVIGWLLVVFIQNRFIFNIK